MWEVLRFRDTTPALLCALACVPPGCLTTPAERGGEARTAPDSGSPGPEDAAARGEDVGSPGGPDVSSESDATDAGGGDDADAPVGCPPQPFPDCSWAEGVCASAIPRCDGDRRWVCVPGAPVPYEPDGETLCDGLDND